MARKLRSGYTTGATASAAAKAATLLLLGKGAGTVELKLPYGDPNAKSVAFEVARQELRECSAFACVVKDGGDDPDVTHGMELCVEAMSCPAREGVNVEIWGGPGIGVVTKPGLGAPVGGPAINPVPRKMIEAAVREAVREAGATEPISVRVLLSAPEGEERAKKTMNARLGVIGGISILGTTGIVIPMSDAAWTGTIDATLDVAKAGGAKRVLLAFGRTSERAGQEHYPEFAKAAAVLMGDHVGYALDAAKERGLNVVLVGQFAKFVKLAAGHYKTHVFDSTLKNADVRAILLEAGLTPEEVGMSEHANTAREVCQKLIESGRTSAFAYLVKKVASRAAERTGGAVDLEVVLFDYSGKLLARAVQKKDKA